MSILHTDGYANAVSGMGFTQLDAGDAGFYTHDRILEHNELEALFAASAFHQRLITQEPNDATREGFDLVKAENLDVDALDYHLQKFRVLKQMGKTDRWARVYGGALAVMVVDDGLRRDQPLNLAGVRSIRGIEIVDSTYADPWNTRQASVINPDIYSVTPLDGSNQWFVHSSRVLRFDGVEVPPRMMFNFYNGWSPSAFQGMEKSLAGLGQAMKLIRHFIHKVSSLVIKIPGIKDMLKGDGLNDLGKTLLNLKKLQNAYNFFAIDDGMEVEDLAQDAASLHDLLSDCIDAVIRDTPMTRLMALGESPHGMNASGKDEQATWDRHVGFVQEDRYTPLVNRYLEIYFASRANANKPVPLSWGIKWRPLSVPNDKEASENRLRNAQARGVDVVSTGIPVDRVAMDPEIDDLYPEAPAAGDIIPGQESVAPAPLDDTQSTKLQSILTAATMAEIPPETAVQMIVMSLPVDEARARALIQPILDGGEIQGDPGEVGAEELNESDNPDTTPDPDSVPVVTNIPDDVKKNLRTIAKASEESGMGSGGIKGKVRRRQITKYKFGNRIMVDIREVMNSIDITPPDEV